jgi:hypothetical protein
MLVKQLAPLSCRLPGRRSYGNCRRGARPPVPRRFGATGRMEISLSVDARAAPPRRLRSRPIRMTKQERRWLVCAVGCVELDLHVFMRHVRRLPNLSYTFRQAGATRLKCALLPLQRDVANSSLKRILATLDKGRFS